MSIPSIESLPVVTLRSICEAHRLKLQGKVTDIEANHTAFSRFWGFSGINAEPYVDSDTQYKPLAAIQTVLTGDEKRIMVYSMAKDLAEVIMPYVLALRNGIQGFELTTAVLVSRVIMPAARLVNKDKVEVADFLNINLWATWACIFMLVDQGWSIQEEPARFQTVQEDGKDVDVFVAEQIDTIKVYLTPIQDGELKISSDMKDLLSRQGHPRQQAAVREILEMWFSPAALNVAPDSHLGKAATVFKEHWLQKLGAGI